jgi:hypothetical protein
MVYRKGELTSKRKLADWPHHVTIPIPELGLGQRLNHMYDFVRGQDYQTVSIRGREAGKDAVIWCFRTEEDAARFRARFALSQETSAPRAAGQ